ncbi:hypothetical protein [Streptomyces alboflavus]|uniref:hypothetical protein n=1 Tax=Streptomyces alboflavus TaxID=67267 RepID=UPI0004C20051|nr:hypothetical protein [Streptomyces alboflavus]
MPREAETPADGLLDDIGDGWNSAKDAAKDGLDSGLEKAEDGWESARKPAGEGIEWGTGKAAEASTASARTAPPTGRGLGQVRGLQPECERQRGAARRDRPGQ